MSKVILCDIDGTLSNPEHRLQLSHVSEKDWKSFFNDSMKDECYTDIVWLVKSLHKLGNKILIVTARPDSGKEVTIKWLDEVAGLKGIYEKLYMRKKDDHRNDYIVKKEILDQILKDGYKPYIVLDDRDSVVDMWRDHGIRCLQVADGDY